MKKFNNKLLIRMEILSCIFLLISCGGGSSETPIEPVASNNPPIANAGEDQTVSTGSLVTLDGAGSSDADGDSLSYTWTLSSRPGGSSAELDNTSTAETHFTADLVGTYNASLIVNDGKTNSTQDLVVITAVAPNSNPIANAGPDQSVSTGAVVFLDGSSSSDPDGDSLTYTWSLDSKPNGSSATIDNVSAERPSFVADFDGTYRASLIVSDGTTNSSPDNVEITASTNNQAPVADAGQDQNIATGTLVILDGTGSSDPNGDSITYSWSFENIPSNSTATLNDSDQAQASFTADVDGLYDVSLTVNDGLVNSASDVVTVTASSSNSIPIADAGIDINVDTNSDVNLNGDGSSDADGDTLSYSWTLETRPAGSNAQLLNADSVQTSFVADRDGVYVASLVVNDGSVDSAPDTVTVTATTNNSSVPSRTPNSITTKQIHSGHSLTDSALFSGTWPGHGISIWSDVDSSNNYRDFIAKSTAPGSSLKWRWDNPPGYGQQDARHDIANWELLVITERVPFNFWDGTEPGSSWYTNSLAYMRLFVENAWNNGNNLSGASTLLYATWGELDSPDVTTWRADLDYHQQFWEQLADYGAENLPADAFVYIIPGNLLMKRIYDDIQTGGIVPEVTSISDFFEDNIHPNGLGQYALALLHLAVIHQINPLTLPEPDYGLSPKPSIAQAEYLKSIVWDVVTSYERAGVPSN